MLFRSLVASVSAVGIYLVPIAHRAGLALEVAATATASSLGAQVVGGLVAISLAGRVKYFPVLLSAAVAAIAVDGIYAFRDPAWLFIGATTLLGFVGVLANAFFVRMTIDADPSRRTALQQGAAQFFGGALGPLLAALVVGRANVQGALALGATMVVAGIGLVAWLHFTHRTIEP